MSSLSVKCTRFTFVSAVTTEYGNNDIPRETNQRRTNTSDYPYRTNGSEKNARESCPISFLAPTSNSLFGANGSFNVTSIHCLLIQSALCGTEAISHVLITHQHGGVIWDKSAANSAVSLEVWLNTDLRNQELNCI